MIRLWRVPKARQLLPRRPRKVVHLPALPRPSDILLVLIPSHYARPPFLPTFNISYITYLSLEPGLGFGLGLPPPLPPLVAIVSHSVSSVLFRRWHVMRVTVFGRRKEWHRGIGVHLGWIGKLES
jgi:hypothetical protein